VVHQQFGYRAELPTSHVAIESLEPPRIFRRSPGLSQAAIGS
jgi:hypothetical protein